MTTKRKTYRLPEDIIDKLISLAKARDKNHTDTIIELIDAASTQTDFLTKNRFKFLDACPGVIFLHQDDDKKEGFYCVHKAPTQKKLGDGSPEDARKICEACQTIKGIIDQNELITKQLKDGFTVRIPFCANGGKLTTDLQRIWCPISTDYKTVTKCKTLRNGANCKHLRWIEAEAQRPQTSPKNSKTGR